MFFTAFFTTYIPWGSLISAIGLILYYWVSKVYVYSFKVQFVAQMFDLPGHRLRIKRRNERPIGVLHPFADNRKLHNKPQTEQPTIIRPNPTDYPNPISSERIAAFPRSKLIYIPSA
jgi:hypothetical protein